jgi:two-component system sensor histidine kinase KdpD
MAKTAGGLLPASRIRRWESPTAGFFAAIACVATATALVYPLRTIAPPVSAGVVYMLGVLVVSTYWGLWLGLFTSVASAVAFNFFHIPPEGTLDVAKGENWVALALFLVVAVIASSLAEQSRARARAAIEAESLRRSDELKTALLRAVSHDLRSPLTAIVAAGEALESESLPDDDRRALAGAVSGEAARLSDLVDKLLDLSRLEGGQAQPRPDWCSIDEVVAAALDDLGERAAHVDLAIDADLPFVRADAAQLERAVVNLLDNAVRFSGGEHVLVSATAAGEKLTIRVADRGPGIPPEDLEAVFEPFYQRPDDRRHDGSGLGLAIVEGLVRVNGGRAWAEPSPFGGATFAIELPLERPVEPPPGLVHDAQEAR